MGMTSIDSSSSESESSAVVNDSDEVGDMGDAIVLEVDLGGGDARCVLPSRGVP